ncbi:hypothetical protein A1QO_17435 [Vibrio genomosp. F10 str. ZF-129]|uniref:Uncharacterized protein n=1 Tax=Vibrio genomosp. F10 str. ZF-129 TaxID=1187848 RepID=A0A1E5BJ42_9VIBR|nr:hypothetical protein [Vibrio genomosp. F10]OEE37520.1 hypothetical protein A1QO_17435 [Vibrio genomosp. F10 str. ZF-129]
MVFDWVEWFGYLASLVVLVSLTMASIVKLRVINFIGCLLFAAFAYFIDSYPTMLMNLGIACINVYYLYQLAGSKDQFKLVSATIDSEYFDHFVATYMNEIERQTTASELRGANTAFYMLRNNAIAGLLAGTKHDNGSFTVCLDYVTAEYRDLKLAQYFYQSNPESIKSRGIEVLLATARTPDHRDYLMEVGFEQCEDNSDTYQKHL